MNEDVPEGHILHELAGGKHHTRHPEEDDVVTRNENARREEPLEIRRFIRPAHGREGPQGRTEPRIEDIRILVNVCAAAVGARRQVRAADADFAAVVTVPGGDLMTPPELTGNTPVVNILKPMIIYLFKPFGNKLRFAVGNGLEGICGQRLHLDKPLLCRKRFDRRLAARTVTDGMTEIFNMIEKVQFLKILYNGLAAFLQGHTVIFRAGRRIHGAVQVHDHD